MVLKNLPSSLYPHQAATCLSVGIWENKQGYFYQVLPLSSRSFCVPINPQAVGTNEWGGIQIEKFLLRVSICRPRSIHAQCALCYARCVLCQTKHSQVFSRLSKKHLPAELQAKVPADRVLTKKGEINNILVLLSPFEEHRGPPFQQEAAVLGS